MTTHALLHTGWEYYDAGVKHRAVHATHPAIVKRLRRAIGQLTTVVSMIEDGRACSEVAQQLQAAEQAITQAKKTLIHDHIDHCLEHSSGNSPGRSRAVIEEFKDISKYL